ncbi:hypothetical protein A3Q56_00094 [Intoshia linei]|uniref:Uncharacterized protein n=1 Tax=Intoshia linei TaxID=1819745 RepID=A0A177BEN3_9BILA|nr:hypothetical protein A3Q56_00094 [Intoshia linei]
MKIPTVRNVLARLLWLKETKKVRLFLQVSKEVLSIYIKTGLNIISLIKIECKIKKLFGEYRIILRNPTLSRAQDGIGLMASTTTNHPYLELIKKYIDIEKKKRKQIERKNGNYKKHYTAIHSIQESIYSTDDDTASFDSSNLKEKSSWRKKRNFQRNKDYKIFKTMVNDISNVVVYFDSKKIDKIKRMAVVIIDIKTKQELVLGVVSQNDGNGYYYCQNSIQSSKEMERRKES